MKIKGQSIKPPVEEIIVLPREGGDIVIKAQPVLNYDDFEALYPEPTPPSIRRRGEDKMTPDPTDPDYLADVSKRFTARYKYMILKSLEATEGIEWDGVKMNDPETWGEAENELKKTFAPAEVNMIFGAVLRANSLDARIFEEAKKRFMSGEAAKAAK